MRWGINVAKDLPEQFLKNMHRLFKGYNMEAEWTAFLDSFSDSAARAYRFNGLKLEGKDEFRRLNARLTAQENLPLCDEAVPWSEDGLYLQDALQVGKTTAFRAGLFYIQEASAMLPAELLAARPGEKILDLCAAPGGKSAKLAAALQGQGVLWSNDINAERAKVLLRNLEQLGVANALVTVAEPRALVQALPAYFDRILVDAPCSGEGMFRRDPQAIRSWAAYSNETLLAIQQDLLESAAAMLKAGGYLVYSTCTFNREENEGQLETFLSAHPEFTSVDTNRSFLNEAGLSPALGNIHAYRLWPHRHQGDGHFSCLLQKRAVSNRISPDACTGRSKSGKTLMTAREAFLELSQAFLSKDFWQSLERLPLERWRIENMRLHLLPDVEVPLNIPAVKLLKTGRFVAELKESRQGLIVKPSHSFLLTLKAHQLSYALDLGEDEERLSKYLRGETLPVYEAERFHFPGYKKDLWLPVLWNNHPLGWSKFQGLSAKNLYPPGWRHLN